MRSRVKACWLALTALMPVFAMPDSSGLRSVSENERVSIVVPYELLKGRDLDIPDYPIGEMSLTYIAGATGTRQEDIGGVRVFIYDPKHLYASRDRLRSSFESWVNTLTPVEHEVGRRGAWRLGDFPGPMIQAVVYESAAVNTLREAVSGLYGTRLMFGYEVQDGNGKEIYAWRGGARTREPAREPVPLLYPDIPRAAPAGSGISQGELDFGPGQIRTLREIRMLAWQEFGRNLSIDRRLEEEAYFISGGYSFETFRRVFERVTKTEPVYWHDTVRRSPIFLGQAALLANSSVLERELGSNWETILQGGLLPASEVLPTDAIDPQRRSLNLPEYRARVRVGMSLVQYSMRPVTRLGNSDSGSAGHNVMANPVIGWD